MTGARQNRIGRLTTFLLVGSAALLPVAFARAADAPDIQTAATPAVEPGAPGPAPDRLFQQVFGQRSKPGRVRQLDLPVKLEGREVGLVPARLKGSDQDTRIDVTALARLIGDLVQQGPLDDLTGRAGPDGFAALGDLAATGIQVVYDATDLSISVSVPPGLRRLTRLDVTGRGEGARTHLILPPAAFSAYVNMRAAVEYLASPDPGRPDGRGPVNLLIEPSSNLLGWVVEGEVQYRENAVRPWTRGPTRLVHDLPESTLRLQAGDLVPAPIGSQVGRPLAGVGVARNFSLQPYRSAQPSGQRDFVLETPAVVEVFVNGRPTRSFRLNPGPYSLGNFPGTSGTNDISIRITDSFGREQVLDFPFFFDSQLLSAGTHEFAYAAGYPYQAGLDGLDYDTRRLSFASIHRIGINDRLTLGASLQADKGQHVAGGDLVLATSLGTFGVEALTSRGGRNGYAVNLRYRDFRSGESIWKQRTVTGQLSWRDNAFTPFGAPAGPNRTALDAAIRISQPLMQDLNATLGARWRNTRAIDLVDGYALDFGLRRRIGRRGSADLTLSHDRNNVGETETGAYLSVRYSFGDGDYNAGASVDTINRERRLDLRYQSPGPANQLSLGLDATEAAGPDRLQGTATFLHQRFLATLRHDAIQRELGTGLAVEHRTQATFSTALVFAGGHVGVSRPVSNSFAIVVPHPRVRDRLIGIDQINGSYTAQSGWFGPAVLPSLGAYLVRPMRIDVVDVPPSYDVGEDRPTLLPGYRTGTVVLIGTDATVSLDGSLVSADGGPLALQSGTLEPIGGDGRTALQFFTNRRGRFRIDSVRPGDWNLRLYGSDAAPITLSVPRDAVGVKSVGELRLSR